MSRVNTPNISTLYSFEEMQCADSIEWCPHEPSQNYFVCANYQLIESSKTENNKQKRIGKIHLFSINQKNELTKHQTIETAAILDQKWCHNKIEDNSVIASVDGDNQLCLYKLVAESSTLELITCFKGEKEDDGDVMMLSLDWSTGRYPSTEPKIVVSDTKGRVHVFQYKNNGFEKEVDIKGHDFEAWICAFYYWDTSVIFTGGDDSKLLKFDLRVGDKPIMTCRAHTAGVTSIHSSKEKEFLLATGSYDQQLMLWDVRKMQNPLKCLEMPGPIWRVKWEPHGRDYLLTACMLGGFHIVDTSQDQLDTVVSYYEHKDLAYGADWSYQPGVSDRLIATCSFYDHKMCVAKVNLENK